MRLKLPDDLGRERLLSRGVKSAERDEKENERRQVPGALHLSLLPLTAAVMTKPELRPAARFTASLRASSPIPEPCALESLAAVVSPLGL